MKCKLGTVCGLGVAWEWSWAMDGGFLWKEVHWKAYLGPWLFYGHFRVSRKREWII